MRILFYGAKGWIGSMFFDYIKENTQFYIFQGTARIDSLEDVKNEIISIKPTHVISFTGRTHGYIDSQLIGTIDYLEYSGKLVENIRDNLFGPMVLSKLSSEYSFHYTYLGTGCIFTDENPGDISFSEEALPNFFGSQYSTVKGFTDQLMKLEKNVLNLRIRMPISNKLTDSRNFITKIMKYEKVCSIANSMTILDDFFPVFLDMIINSKTGTYNCTNPGLITHNSILELYKKIVDPSFTWKNMTLQEQRVILKSDRSNNFLDTTKLEREYPYVMNIKDSIKNIFVKLKLDDINNSRSR
jgi:dTDP-4-dehydrorhamnose reductase